MKYSGRSIPPRIRHRQVDRYVISRLSRDVRWISAWQRNVVQQAKSGVRDEV